MMKDNLRLLIVDDDPDDRELFMEAVREVDESIECFTAKNGLQALEILRDLNQQLPDLIFLDISMPLLNGRKCLTEIKADKRLQQIPVVVYTTSKDVEEARELKKMGAFHFMSNPRDADEIYYIVAVVLEEFRLAAGAKE